MTTQRRTLFQMAVTLCIGWLMAGAVCAAGAGTRYTGQVLYQGTKTPAPGVMVEIVEAEDNGKPRDDDDDVLASVRADTQGRFTVILTKSTDDPVALVVSAVRVSARSGGDRRHEGYDIKSKRTVLGFLIRPSPIRSNTVLIEHRRPGRPSRDSDD